MAGSLKEAAAVTWCYAGAAEPGNASPERVWDLPWNSVITVARVEYEDLSHLQPKFGELGSCFGTVS